MMTRNIVIRTVLFFVAGAAIVTLLCIIEFFTGTGLTHPLWDESYTWIPLIRDVLVVSFGGALLSSIVRYFSENNGYSSKIIVMEGTANVS